MPVRTGASRAGQSRAFDVDAVLEVATRLFWEHGYEATSISMITAATGVNPPSLYAAYGDKRRLFLRVIEHYNATHGSFMAEAFREESTAAGLVHRLLHGAAEHYSDPRFPGGCLIISAAVNVTAASREVADDLRRLRIANVIAIAERLRQAQASGELSSDLDADSGASYLAAIIQGLSQQARDGASTAQLHAIADIALQALPALDLPSVSPTDP
ncbi:TetR/AcrR family transcriptional regulator [Kineococcus arenarius]|uniref:TetR/AcrR family transcriptional regulator n=1 Tax=unclassified Kineococcus TaxID=2621656 RepID=UPI003D7F0960